MSVSFEYKYVFTGCVVLLNKSLSHTNRQRANHYKRIAFSSFTAWWAARAVNAI